MKRLLRVVLVGCFVALSLSLAESADAWTRTTDPMYVWRVLPATFVIDANGVVGAAGGPGAATAGAALDTAIANWNATGSNWMGVRRPNVTTHAPDNGVSEIYWLRAWDPALGDVNSVLAVADSNITGVGPEFTTVETDVVFNGDRFNWAGGAPAARTPPEIGATTTVAVLTHEVGHGLGIGHSEVEAAIMYFRANSEGAALDADDRTAARTLYPPGGPLCTLDAQCPLVPGTSSRCAPGGTCESVPPGELGAACDGAAMRCAAGLTCRGVGEGGSFRCTRNCTSEADCAGSTFCASVSGGEAFCFPPGPTPLGGACTFLSDCQSGRCFSSVCRAACTAEDCECAIGERCTSSMVGTLDYGFCFPGASTCVRCGDGVIGGDEVCDDGEGNSDLIADTCRSTCMEAGCGDGVVDTGEECDDGNIASGDGCAAECLPEPDAGVPDLDSGVDGGGDAGPRTDGGVVEPDGAVTEPDGSGVDGALVDQKLQGGCACGATRDEDAPQFVFWLLLGWLLVLRRRGAPNGH